jgi:hypothetical protein
VAGRFRNPFLPVLCAHGELRTFAGRLIVLTDGLGTAIGAPAIFTFDPLSRR